MTRLAVDPSPVQLVEGAGLLEGPVWNAGALEFVSVNRGFVYRLEGDRLTVAVETGGSPNGQCIDGAGVRWVAQNGGTRVASKSRIAAPPSLQRVEGGVVEAVAADGLAAPNDVAIGPSGLVWFTDPPWYPDDRIEPGNVYVYDPAEKTLTAAISGIEFPNGLAFSEDGRDLFLVETARQRVLRYRIDGSRASFAGVHVEIGHGGPDGIALACDGSMIVANGHADNIVVVDPDGRIAQIVDLSALGRSRQYFPTNVCFGAPGSGTIYATLASGGRIFRFDTSLEGLPGLGGIGQQLENER